MAEDLTSWAPKIAVRLRTVPARITRRLQALLDDAKRDARRTVHVDTGVLKRSIYSKLTARSLELGATAPYARIEEEGGILRPERARYLAVPLQRGLPRMGPRADGNLFAFRSRDGRLFLASRQGGNLDVRWRLMESVTRKPHPYLRPAMERLAKRLPKEVGDEMAATLLGKVVR